MTACLVFLVSCEVPGNPHLSDQGGESDLEWRCLAGEANIINITITSAVLLVSLHRQVTDTSQTTIRCSVVRAIHTSVSIWFMAIRLMAKPPSHTTTSHWMPLSAEQQPASDYRSASSGKLVERTGGGEQGHGDGVRYLPALQLLRFAAGEGWYQSGALPHIRGSLFRSWHHLPLSSVGNLTRFEQRVFLDGILLGGSLTDYYNVIDRDYNMGSGYSVKAISFMEFGKVATFQIGADYYRIFTWKGYEGKDLATTDPLYLNAQGDKEMHLCWC